MKPPATSGHAHPAADATAFAPGLLRLQQQPPAPLAGAVLLTLCALLGVMIVWAALARLDIVAVAEGKLVPASYVKILQPPEQGVVREILVREGEAVQAHQVLARMDAVVSGADRIALASEFHARRLALRRIDAQLTDAALVREEEDPAEMYARVNAQYQANVQALAAQLAQEHSVHDKARHELKSAEVARAKLSAVLPHYREQEAAFGRLVQGGFAGKLMYTDKQRERIEKEQDLASQEAVIEAARASVAQSQGRIRQITADYRRLLQTERVEVAAQLEKARQELAKGEHRHGLLELRAPQDGVIKDLATHTPGTVVSPGTILMTLVPRDETLRAEVWVSNQDVGFVRAGLPVKLKLAAFPFTKYGMLEGTVAQLSADATEAPSANTRSDALTGRDRPMGPLSFRALVDLRTQTLNPDGERLRSAPGMQVVAEIAIGQRTVMEYVLSPVQRAWQEAGRER
ncbi:MAG: HlyD family type I secretion periplasmic adaptor subunit [Betaproteobacteria bacterium]|nr:HlyD family type I secretion periplasmic adaptor subunit [Betaproteobacteria bacterium]